MLGVTTLALLIKIVLLSTIIVRFISFIIVKFISFISIELYSIVLLTTIEGVSNFNILG